MSRLTVSYRSLTKQLSSNIHKHSKYYLSLFNNINHSRSLTTISNKFNTNNRSIFNNILCNFSTEAKINEEGSDNNSKKPQENTENNDETLQSENTENIESKTNENEDSEDDSDMSESEYETDDDSEEKIEELNAQIKALEEERDTFRNGMARLQADLLNVQRMSEKDVKKAKDFALKKFSGDILSVADALESCMKLFNDNEKFHLDFEKEEHKDIKQIYDGILLTHKALLDSFRRNGIEKFESINQEFDPKKHEALFNVPSQKDDDVNKVKQIISEGYTINSHILRPAKVGVGAKQ